MRDGGRWTARGRKEAMPFNQFEKLSFSGKTHPQRNNKKEERE